MKKLIFIVIMLTFSLQSCGSITDIFGLAKEAGITWNPKDDSKAIDSINVISKPCYWVESIDTLNYEKEFVLNGYKVWILQTDNIRRIEVIRLDTNIYIYKK